jgi:Ner family transcriptional regulator
MAGSNWTRNAIIFALRERGVTAAGLAADAGMSRSTFYSAMQRPYPRVHRIIAAAVGKPVHEIWPAFYNPDGSRRGLISRSAA